MSKYDELRRGDYLMSNNHEWKAVFQVKYTCPVSVSYKQECTIISLLKKIYIFCEEEMHYTFLTLTNALSL